MKLTPMDSFQSLTEQDITEITYKIDIAILLKMAEAYTGQRVVIDKPIRFHCYSHNLSFADAFEPFELFLEWTGLGEEETAYTPEDSLEIRQYKIGKLQGVKELESYISEELKSEFNSIVDQVNAMDRELTESGLSFGIHEETGLFVVYCEYISAFEWHLVIPSLLQVIDEIEEFYKKCLNEVHYYENSRNI